MNMSYLSVTAFSYSQYEDSMVSQILTLDLQPYPLAEEDREKETQMESIRPV